MTAVAEIVAAASSTDKLAEGSDERRYYAAKDGETRMYEEY
jgi:hypothetical protein